MSNTQWYIGKEKGIEHILTRPVNAAAAPQDRCVASSNSVEINTNTANTEAATLPQRDSRPGCKAGIHTASPCPALRNLSISGIKTG